MGQLKFSEVEEVPQQESWNDAVENDDLIDTELGKFWTDNFEIQDNGWITFIPTAWEKPDGTDLLPTEKNEFNLPPQKVRFADPPAGTGTGKWVAGGALIVGVGLMVAASR